MKTTQPMRVNRVATEVTVNKFRGIDRENSDATRPLGWGLVRENVEVSGGRILPLPSMRQMPLAAVTPKVGAFSEVHADGKFWGFGSCGTTTGMYFVLLSYISSENVAVSNCTWNGANADAKLLPIRDRLIAMGGGLSGIKAIEQTGSSTWAQKDYGLTPPYINDILTASGDLTGQYQYGVEFVVISGNVITKSTGISRKDSAGNKRSPIEVVARSIYIYVQDVPTSPYTHIRLWRSKRLDVDENGIIAGNDSTLYCVKSVARATFETTKDGSGIGHLTDQIVDQDLPVLSTGETIPTTPEVLDLLPAGSAKYAGVVGGSQIFFAGFSDDTAGVYPSAGVYGSRYEEQYSPADRVGVVGGGPIKGLHGFGEDLVIQTESSFWRLPNADPLAVIIKVADAPPPVLAQGVLAVTGVGIYIIHGKGVIGVLNTDYVWLEDLPGRSKEASKGILKGRDLSKLRMGYVNNRLCIVGVTNARCLVYDPEYGFFSWGPSSPLAIWTGPKGYPAFATDYGSYWVVADYAAGTEVTLPSTMDVGPFQAPDMGDGVSEVAYLRVEGGATSAKVRREAAEGSETFERLMALTDSGSSTKKFTLTDIDPLPSAFYGQRLFFEITLTGPIEEVGAGLYVQGKGLMEQRHDADDEAQNLSLLSDLYTGVITRFTRPSPLEDMFGLGAFTEV